MDIVPEPIDTHVAAYGKTVRGCQKHDRDVMISVMHGDDEKTLFTDIMMTTRQAEHLQTVLAEVLRKNSESINPPNGVLV